MKAKRTILMFGHAGSANRGCEAIIRSTATLLKAAGGPGVFVRVASRAPQEDLAARIDAVDAVMDTGRRWPENPAVRRLHAALSWRARSLAQRFILDNLRTLAWAPRADLCLVVGGDNYCYDTIGFWYPLQRLLRFLSRRMVLWGCSIEPERMDPAMLADLRRYDLITARESITEAALKAQGLPRVWRHPDPAFTLAEERLPLPAGWREGQMAGLNLSPLVESFERDPGRALAACLELVRHILDTTDLDVALVPHVTWKESDDRIPLGKIREAFAARGRVLQLPDGLNAPQTKGYISRCRFFVGARTHATIAAYSTGVPTLVLGYSVKARGIARDLFGDETGLVLPVQDLAGADGLVRLFDGLRAREAELRAHLAAVMPGQVRAAQEGAREVLRLLER